MRFGSMGTGACVLAAVLSNPGGPEAVGCLDLALRFAQQPSVGTWPLSPETCTA